MDIRTSDMELGREILSELPPHLLRLITPSGSVLMMDPAVLQSSRVLRKLASDDGEIVLSDKVTLSVCERAALLPHDIEEFDAWLDALDYLCAEPPPELFLGAVARAFRHLLSRRSDGAIPFDVGEEIARRRFLVSSLTHEHSPPLPAEPSSPPRARKRSCPWETESHSVNGSDSDPVPEGELLNILGAANRGMLSSVDFEAKSPSRLWSHARRQVRCALLGTADSLAGAIQVCRHVQLLVPLLTSAQVRWLVHRAIASLYAAERDGQPHFVCLGAVCELQRAYKKSYLDLAGLLPPIERSPQGRRRRQPLFLLPCCAGRARVPLVRGDTAWVRRACERRVPWLGALWERGEQDGIAYHLTGSMLTAVLLPRAGALVKPGDVDVFVLQQSSLELASRTLTDCITTLHHGAVVESKKVGPSKYRVRFTLRGQDSAVDLYAHPLTRIHQYHMSAARVAFDGTRLFCSMSGAIALATGVSVCFNMTHKVERAASILFRRWRAGASLLVNEDELRAFIQASQNVDANLTTQQKQTVAEFRSPVARNKLEMHLRHADTFRQQAVLDYDEWRTPPAPKRYLCRP